MAAIFRISARVARLSQAGWMHGRYGLTAGLVCLAACARGKARRPLQKHKINLLPSSNSFDLRHIREHQKRFPQKQMIPEKAVYTSVTALGLTSIAQQ
jgi:hypothetical protein